MKHTFRISFRVHDLNGAIIIDAEDVGVAERHGYSGANFVGKLAADCPEVRMLTLPGSCSWAEARGKMFLRACHHNAYSTESVPHSRAGQS